MAVSLKDATEVFTFIVKHLKKVKFRGETQEYLPGAALRRATTKEVVRDVVSRESVLFLSDLERDSFIKKVHQEAPKIFAICIFGRLSMSDLKSLVDRGLTDINLPLQVSDCPKNCDATTFERSFIDYQKKFNPVFFGLSSYQSLEDDCPKPIELCEDSSNLIGKGAFGEVWRVRIDRDHRGFSSVSILCSIILHSLNICKGADKENQFAMKITPHETRERPFHRAMVGLDHPHLLKCYASFTFSFRYHMIYEKADCDMEEFIKTNKTAADVPSLTPQKLATQLYGLAAALSVIHNQGQPDAKDRSGLLNPGSAADLPSKTGYIHDIKPENLLMFIYEQEGKKTYWLRLSDFSCARVADFVASISGKRKASWRSDSKSGTPVYRAPESMYEKTSRPYDLWSLGCVYLELLVWYLEGFDKLKEFRDTREREVRPGGACDEGFYYTNDSGPKPNFHLRDVVQKKMAYVIQNSDKDLKHIAEAIPRLLNVNPGERPTADKLARDLKRPYMEEKPPFGVEPVSVNELPPSLTPPSPYAHDSGTGSGSDTEYGGPNQFKLTVQQPLE
jgi:serine/threonine protein kinase